MSGREGAMTRHWGERERGSPAFFAWQEKRERTTAMSASTAVSRPMQAATKLITAVVRAKCSFSSTMSSPNDPATWAGVHPVQPDRQNIASGQYHSPPSSPRPLGWRTQMRSSGPIALGFVPTQTKD